MNDKDVLNTHIKLIKERQNRILYTYKTHEKAADRAESYEKWRKRFTILFTAIGATTFVASVVGMLGSVQLTNLVVSFIALLATALSLIGDIFDFKEEARQHTIAGVKLREIFQAYESLHIDLSTGNITLEECRFQRDLLAEKEALLLTELPRTTRRDYVKADNALSGDEKIDSCSDPMMRKEV